MAQSQHDWKNLFAGTFSKNETKSAQSNLCKKTIQAAMWDNRIFAYAKTKTQISFAVTAKLISIFVFPTWIVQYFFYLNPKFQVTSYIQWFSSPVYVCPSRKPQRPVFSKRGSYTTRHVFALQTSGCLLLHERSAESSCRSFLRFFHLAISNCLHIANSESTWMNGP